MREHVRSASLRRDQRLAQVRSLTLWITGGAAAGSLALGVAFAHAIPGHATSTAGTAGSSANGTASQPATASSPGGTDDGGEDGTAKRHHHHRLAAPASAPTSKPAPAPPPVVTSGGS